MNVKQVKQIIENKIDHYMPYRPITDSKEMQEVRKVLWKILEKIEANEKEEDKK